MARVARPGGIVAAYVWDYAEGMQMMRHFWDAAALDPSAVELDEGRRFTMCKPEPLIDLFQTAGLEKIEARAIDVPTVFHDFDDYRSPFLGGQAPAPGYAMSLSEEQRAALRERIRATLPTNSGVSPHRPRLGRTRQSLETLTFSNGISRCASSIGSPSALWRSWPLCHPEREDSGASGFAARRARYLPRG